MGMRYIEVEQTHSPARRHFKQRATLIGLHLNKIGRISYVPDNPASRGMISKVAHLVRITNDPANAKIQPAPPIYDEAADANLMKELAFTPNGIELEAYSEAELKRGKTPDFKLNKDGALCGYCELKSPRDDNVLGTPEPGGVSKRRIPYPKKLGNQVCNASAQFKAVNPDHTLPNVLVFVNHSPDIGRRDLLATIAGLDGGRIFMLGKKLQHKVWAAARNIDLVLWIDAKGRVLRHLVANDAKHKSDALAMFGITEGT